ncbi:MAG TPA: hypothetical protein VIG44_08950 [Thermomicrobiales bacterium]
MNAPELLDVVAPDHADDGDSGAGDAADSARRGVGIWMLLLVLVIVFGYLTTSRRKALGTLIEQIADIIQDFRGYDPEF